jgi:hypothetical protein
MEPTRRSFFKNLGLTAFSLTFFKLQSASANHKNDSPDIDEENGSINVDRSLHYLSRPSSKLPDHPQGYYTSYHHLNFRLKIADLERGSAVFLVQDSEVQFMVTQASDRIYFKSVNGAYHFFWKPKSGLYALDSQDSTRILELCQPEALGLQYMANCDLKTSLDWQGECYSELVRDSYTNLGIPQSPLPGLEGFGEESLHFDSSDNGYSIVAKGLDNFLNTIPMGLVGLKTLAVTSPKIAVEVVESVIPKVFGWMTGPIQNPEPGKLVLTKCPYRERMGTQVCENTCGHAIGKYFSEEIRVPMRFDPTVDNYRTCHILIGKKQCSKV